MAFVDKSNTKKIYAYLTQQGREKILTGDTKDFIVTDFSLHDDDVNYYISANKINSEYNLLPSGFIPDVTGDNQDCTVSVVDQLLNNELFGSVPPPVNLITGCGISSASNYNPNADIIDNTLCTFPPPQPLNLVDVIGQCDTEPFKFKISVNNIDGGTPPYKWNVETNFGDNNSAPYNTLRNEGDVFIFDTPNQGNATYTVKVKDSATPPLTAQKQFTNISCTPTGPYIKISGSCSVEPTELANRTATMIRRPVWFYSIKIEYVTPPKSWKYIIISKALSPSPETQNSFYRYFPNLDGEYWDGFLTTRPNVVPKPPGSQPDQYGNNERRTSFNNTNQPYLTEIIKLPGNVGKLSDYQIIFYDDTLSFANQVVNRVTAFTVTDVFCAPNDKLRLQIFQTNKYLALNRYNPIDYIENYGFANPFVIYDEQEIWEGTRPSELFPFNYITPSVAPTRIMNFHNYTLDHGFKKITTQYNWQIDAVEISIPFYIAYDDLGNDYADIYAFTKANIPSDLKIQFKTVGTYNKQNIKFPQIGNPKIDWTEGADGATYSPEYVLVDVQLEQPWTYNGRQQRPVFTRYDKSTSPYPEDGEKIYALYSPGYTDIPSYDALNPGLNETSGQYQVYDPPLQEFSGLEGFVNQRLSEGQTLTDIGSTGTEYVFGTRRRQCVVYKYILPIRFNPKLPGTAPSAQKSVLNLKVEMICNHPDISTINTGWDFTYPANTYEIQLEVANNQIF
jgi:hypothetical protein